MRIRPYNPEPYDSKLIARSLRTPTITDQDAKKQLSPQKRKLPPPLQFSKCNRFTAPPNTTDPTTIFSPGQAEGVTGPRFIRDSKQSQILIFTSGYSPQAKSQEATAGWSFVFRPPGRSRKDIFHDGTVAFRLEVHGPRSEPATQTTERAELRAVIAALQYRVWHIEGWKSIVIATDSDYVVSGATENVDRWIAKKWKTTRGKRVLNRDLWELLMKVIKKIGGNGVEVLFWKISREENKLACEKAKEAAAAGEYDVEFTEHRGIEM